MKNTDYRHRSSRDKWPPTGTLLGAGIVVTLLGILLCWSIFFRSDGEPPSLSQDRAPILPPPDSEPPASATPEVSTADLPTPNETSFERLQGDGSIHAVVTDRDGTAIQGAAVTLASHSAGDSNAEALRLSESTSTTGEVQFEALPWGRYQLVAVRGEEAGRLTVGLRSGQAACSVEIVLKPAGVIEGQVADDLGQPLAGAEVLALDTSHKEQIDRVVTDDGGHFAFAAVPLAHYVLQASAAGYAPSLSDVVSINGPPVTITLGPGGTLAGAVLRASNRSAVAGVSVQAVSDDYFDVTHSITSDEHGRFSVEHVPSGAVLLTGADTRFALAPPEVSTDVTVGRTAQVELFVEEGARVTGTVYHEATGEPVPGMVVAAIDEVHRTGGWRSAPTGADGRYRLDMLPPGRIAMQLTSVPPALHAGADPLKTTVDLRPGETLEGIDFQIDTGLSVCGVVVGAGGRPVAGAAVTLAKSDPRKDEPFDFLKATSDGTGHFCITNVRLRMVEVARDQFEPEQCSLEADFRGARSEPLTLPHFTENVSGVTLTLQPRPSGVIAGSVVDERGAPAMAALSLTQPYVTSGFDRRLLTTDADGHFLFQDLAPGDYEIWMAPDSGTGYNTGKTLAQSLALAAGQRVTDLRLTVLAPGVISGTLLDDTGAPMQHMNIEAWDVDKQDFASAAFTDREGRFRITIQEGERFILRPREDTPGGIWSVRARPGDDVEIRLTAEILQGKQPPTPGYIVDPETGEERLSDPEAVFGPQADAPE